MAEPTKLPKIKFSNDLLSCLTTMDHANDYIAFMMLAMLDEESGVFNGLKITNVDVSDKDFCFYIKTQDGKTSDMKVGNFLRYYFNNYFTKEDIQQFVEMYNKIKNGESLEDQKVPIHVQPFKYNPLDPRSTFLSLVTKTYPHGLEDEVLQFLPELDKDLVGNYYKIIGSKPTTMFTCHLDTADRKQGVTRLYSIQEDGQEHIITDGSTILGADDKSGTTVMLYLMANNVPGLYYFFIGEERGGIGSHALADVYDEVDYLKEIKRCVSFDRRKTISVITAQAGGRCCSDDFGQALCDAYNASGLNLKIDPTGVYTDSASFIDHIPECTNVSVGYYNEHTGKEKQNMDYLIELCKASVNVDWDKLPTTRNLEDKIAIKQMVSDIKGQNQPFLDAIKSSITLDKTISVDYGDVYANFDLENEDCETIITNLTSLRDIMKIHRKATACYFDETYLQIKLGKDKPTAKLESLKSYHSFVNEARWEDDNEDEFQNEYGKDDESDDEADNMEHLLYLLRQLLSKAGIKNMNITNQGLSLKIEVIPPSYGMVDYFYKLDDVITIYETIKKIDKDVLVDYDLECDIWETKKMEPLLIFNFYSLDDDLENNEDDEDYGMPF
jgi:hypothetical protein